jgi:hypothetical protein
MEETMDANQEELMWHLDRLCGSIVREFGTVENASGWKHAASLKQYGYADIRVARYDFGVLDVDQHYWSIEFGYPVVQVEVGRRNSYPVAWNGAPIQADQLEVLINELERLIAGFAVQGWAKKGPASISRLKKLYKALLSGE